MKNSQNIITFLILVIVVSFFSHNFLAYGQQSATTNGQQTATTNGQPPTINNYYGINPPPNPVAQQPAPPLPQGASNNTGRQGQNGQEGQVITDPLVLTIAFVGAVQGSFTEPYIHISNDSMKWR